MKGGTPSDVCPISREEGGQEGRQLDSIFKWSLNLQASSLRLIRSTNFQQAASREKAINKRDQQGTSGALSHWVVGRKVLETPQPSKLHGHERVTIDKGLVTSSPRSDDKNLKKQVTAKIH